LIEALRRAHYEERTPDEEWRIFSRFVADGVQSYLFLREKSMEVRCAPTPSLGDSDRLSTEWLTRWVNKQLGEPAI
jgi:hypothetical protein